VKSVCIASPSTITNGGFVPPTVELASATLLSTATLSPPLIPRSNVSQGVYNPATGLFDVTVLGAQKRDSFVITVSQTCASTFVAIHAYIDPSGVVVNQLGTPIVGAQVELLVKGANGAFSVVEDGSAIMSPNNRRNPDETGPGGEFRWDTLAGTYKVRASAEGCTAPGDPSRVFVETPELVVPPPAIDLSLQLNCPAPAVLQPVTADSAVFGATTTNVSGTVTGRCVSGVGSTSFGPITVDLSTPKVVTTAASGSICEVTLSEQPGFISLNGLTHKVEVFPSGASTSFLFGTEPQEASFQIFARSGTIADRQFVTYFSVSCGASFQDKIVGVQMNSGMVVTGVTNGDVCTVSYLGDGLSAGSERAQTLRVFGRADTLEEEPGPLSEVSFDFDAIVQPIYNETGVVPSVECVSVNTDGTLSAKLAATVSGSRAVLIKRGPNNSFNGSLSLQREVFLPGVPNAGTATFNATAAFSWTLDQKTVTASRSTKRCVAAGLQTSGVSAIGAAPQPGVAISGAGSSVLAPVHSEAGVSLSGARIRLTGGVRYVTDLVINGAGNTIDPAAVKVSPNTVRPAAPNPSDFAPGGPEALAATTSYRNVDGGDCTSGTWSPNVSALVDGTTYYVNCGVRLAGSGGTKKVTIVANGAISVSGAGWILESVVDGGPVLLATGSNSITVSGAKVSLKGSITSAGDVTVSGANYDIAGLIVGRVVELRGANGSVGTQT
jgi:hypothetical protein